METRRQTLFEALMCEIEERHPYPLGRKSLPFDRQLHPIFSRVEVVKLEKLVWGRPSFWGKEPMTRLMRVNKQLYEEVYQILWSDFALHVASLNALHETAVLDWLETTTRAPSTVSDTFIFAGTSRQILRRLVGITTVTG
jgi:hypothetical protein